MKKHVPLLFLLLFCLPLSAQKKIYISYNPGISLFNSENSKKTTGDKHIRWFPGISLACAVENLWGLNVSLGYDYSSKRIYDVQAFARTGPTGPEIIGYSNADLILACHNFDISLYDKANDWLSFGAGPTLSFVNRSIVIDDLPSSGFENTDRSFEDRLLSLCLGFNYSVNIEVPLETGTQHFFFFSALKLRYLHSVWFDDRGRNLDNYHQSLLFGQLCIGLGYNI